MRLVKVSFTGLFLFFCKSIHLYCKNYDLYLTLRVTIITVNIYILYIFQASKTIEYIYKIRKGILYTMSNTSVCVKLARLHLILYTGGHYYERL